MPTLLPVWIVEYICATLASRIRLRIALVPSMLSCAATRPMPSFILHRVCEITACSDSDSIARTISFSSAGNTDRAPHRRLGDEIDVGVRVGLPAFALENPARLTAARIVAGARRRLAER